jgi:hypothetical protein
MRVKPLCKLIGQITSRLSVIAVIIVLGLYWGRLLEALLVLVAVFQFELAYRQYWLSKIRDEPIFAVSSSKQNDGSIVLSIRNAGSTPAYLVSIGRIICNGTPLSPKEWCNYVKSPELSCLLPSMDGTLAIIDGNFYERCFIKSHCKMEILYFNKYGELKNFILGFHKFTPLISAGEEKPPGFLLSIGEYFAIVKSLIALRKLKHKH